MATYRPFWELRSVVKTFPGVRALDGVSLALRIGEIHALLGENGSGKSTLAKVLSGVHQPDAGEVFQRGELVVLRDPHDAQTRGVATFHQEFSLVPELSVAENIYLGRLPQRRGVVDWSAARRGSVEALARLNVKIDPDRKVASLSVAEQQFVEIAKAISRDMMLLILDEPTAALGPAESERLHGVTRVLAQQGTAILYISHRLDEVFAVADVVTVLKDGKLVGTNARRETSVREAVRMMIGSDLEEHFDRRENARERPRLEVRDVRTENRVNGVSFAVAEGEVLGFGGIAGAGRTEIARALFGLDRITEGDVLVDGRRVELRSPGDAIEAGIALMPENRKADGLFFNFEGPANITIAGLGAIQIGPFLSLTRERRRARKLMQELRIDRRAEDRSVRFLSGGNQQKVMLARWLFARTRVLILDEPTQGIDVSAKQEVYRVINELTADGIAVVLISSDFPELLAISDRVAVVRSGCIIHFAEYGELSEHELVELAAGGGANEVAA
ncbi:MAG: sugar ABC transporter ATP-binding protein [Actinobacteria bacterium]|nr:sugar ABC transporter ATP-binding protein [Actinomycetota bacterium]